MSCAYPIGAPVKFVNNSENDTINFNACRGKRENIIVNFGTKYQGDLLVRDYTTTSNSLSTIKIGKPGQVLAVTGENIKEVALIKTVGDSNNSLNGTYFLLNSPTKHYYFWIKTSSGNDVDPGTIHPYPSDIIGDGKIKEGRVINIDSNSSPNDVALRVCSVINQLRDFEVNTDENEVTITSTIHGAVDPNIDGITRTNFSFSTITEGESVYPKWMDSHQTSLDAFMSSIISCDEEFVSGEWNDLSTNCIWDETSSPNHNFTGLFNDGYGYIGVDGLYSISASVSIVGNNTGSGIIQFRRAIRQLRVYNTTTKITVALCEVTPSSSSLNPSLLGINVSSAFLTNSDNLVLQFRHDASTPLRLNTDKDNRLFFSIAKL